MTRTMRWLAGGALCLLAACGGDGGSAPSPSSFAGTWDATRMLWTEKANPAVTFELIDAGGAFVIIFDDDGTWTATVTQPGEAPEAMTGTWHASRDVFTLRQTGEPFDWQFDYTLSGGTLTLVGGDVQLDIDQDGQEEETDLDLTLVRR